MEKMTAVKRIALSGQRKIAEKQQKLGPIPDTYYDHSYDPP